MNQRAPAWEGKWKAHDAARIGTDRPDGPQPEPAVHIPTGKVWLLRWAWLISTGMLVIGAILIVIILAGQGHRIGL
jgi:hypothetical protein